MKKAEGSALLLIVIVFGILGSIFLYSWSLISQYYDIVLQQELYNKQWYCTHGAFSLGIFCIRHCYDEIMQACKQKMQTCDVTTVCCTHNKKLSGQESVFVRFIYSDKQYRQPVIRVEALYYYQGVQRCCLAALVAKRDCGYSIDYFTVS